MSPLLSFNEKRMTLMEDRVFTPSPHGVTSCWEYCIWASLNSQLGWANLMFYILDRWVEYLWALLCWRSGLQLTQWLSKKTKSTGSKFDLGKGIWFRESPYVNKCYASLITIRSEEAHIGLCYRLCVDSSLHLWFDFEGNNSNNLNVSQENQWESS